MSAPHSQIRNVRYNIRVARVPDTVGTTDESLEGDVGDKLAKRALTETYE